MESRVLDVYGAAEYLNADYRTVLALIRDGRLPAAKLSRSWRIHIDTLEAWVKLKRGVYIEPPTTGKKRGKKKVAARAAKH